MSPRLVLLSDTHNRHERLEVPTAQVLIHSGDFTRSGSKAEVLRFLDWLARQPAAHRLLVAGNHDRFAESAPEAMRAACVERGIAYLIDEEIEVAGLRVWGAPWTPRFRSMAFNLDRGEALAEKWRRIPDGIDILVTHGPPHGILDRVILGGARVGCEELRGAVERRNPRLHVFGHIHEAAGSVRVGSTRFVNAACCRIPFGLRAPVTIDWPV